MRDDTQTRGLDAGLKAVGESVQEPLAYFDNNVGGTLSLLQAMQEAGVSSIVFSSSATVYGEPQYLPLDEAHPTAAVTPYGRTKLHVEEMLADLCRAEPAWRVACLRYFNPAGAHPSGLIGEDPNGIPNNLMPYIAKVANGELPSLGVFGNDYPSAPDCYPQIGDNCPYIVYQRQNPYHVDDHPQKKELFVSVADFLFTPSVQRVLGATLTHPERSFTLQELLRLAGRGRGSTQLQIDRLVEAGVLQEEPRRGRQRSIRANTSFFLYQELASIARKSFALAEPVKAALEPFSSNIEEAFLFGSVVKGTDTSKSDVDLVVVGTASLLDLTESLHKAEQDLGRPIHLSLYEPAEWNALSQSDPVMAQIANGPKIRVLPDDKTD